MPRILGIASLFAFTATFCMQPVDVLDAATIRHTLAAHGEALTAHGEALAAHGEALTVEVLASCESTNTVLLDRPAGDTPHLLLADAQTAGRGRRGRGWISAPGAALTFSLAWSFAGPVGRLRGLSLAIGVGLARALHALGAHAVRLKWPNDLLVPQQLNGQSVDAKLGGVLIETRARSGVTHAVVGVGLNWRRLPGLDARLGRRVASLEDLLDPLPSRNALAASLAAELARTLRTFDREGLALFRAEWETLHAYQGERLKVRTGDGRVLAGTAEGIAEDGALLLRNRRGLHPVSDASVMRARTS